MTRSRQTADWGSRAGLAKIIPSSVAVGSGTGSADTVGNVTFSGASSVSLNGVFTSTYDNYEIIINHTCSANASAYFRLRNAGSDYTSSTYYAGMVSYFTDTTTLYGETSAAAAQAYIGEVSDSKAFTKFSISGALIAERKILIGTTYRTRVTGPTGKGSTFGVFVNSTSTYDGFTFYPSSGTITGTMVVYGYND